MKTPTTGEARRLRDLDFKRREQPRMVWDSQRLGTLQRKPRAFYEPFQPTLAEINAAARKKRRRQNKTLRGWLPYAKR